ncbi:hypothetical protein [Deinococcus yavapaiensis]|uniref:Uncharacterized protein n=1 Tax=Deinococcus yavapaiensis KR-236 TaxID=694435 RepID=A0A318SBQ2_9DEIO|nr:hypothetical protein [Deinococcus yavapaiensis]PYE55784.1 hypothetical protein DES52_102149 [Deinococcus yavapaiensis KR-236]
MTTSLDDLLLKIAVEGALPRGAVTLEHLEGDRDAVLAVLGNASAQDLHALFRRALFSLDGRAQELVASAMRERLDVTFPLALMTRPDVFHKAWLLSHVTRLKFYTAEPSLGQMAVWLRKLGLTPSERLSVCFPGEKPQQALLAATILDADTTPAELALVAHEFVRRGIGGLTTWLELLKHASANDEVARCALGDREVIALVQSDARTAPKLLRRVWKEMQAETAS